SLFRNFLCNHGGYIWCGSMEPEQNCGLGLGYYQLCMVDRYWPRRYFDLSDLIIVPSGVENWCESCCRSDDNICSNVCRPVSYLAHGSGLECFFCFVLSQYPWPLMALL